MPKRSMKAVNSIAEACKRNWQKIVYPIQRNFEIKYPIIEYTVDGEKVLMEENGKMKYLFD